MLKKILISCLCVSLLLQWQVFSLTWIELTTTSGSFTNQDPTYLQTTITNAAGDTTFTIPIDADQYNYVWQYWDETVVNETWSTVTLDHELCDPMVVGSPTYDVNANPQRGKRFRNLDQDSFEVKVDYNNGNLTENTVVDWIVMEKWAHTFLNGAQIQAWSSPNVTAVQNATPNCLI